jgi:hypothetical protein
MACTSRKLLDPVAVHLFAKRTTLAAWLDFSSRNKRLLADIQSIDFLADPEISLLFPAPSQNWKQGMCKSGLQIKSHRRAPVHGEITFVALLYLAFSLVERASCPFFSF